MADSKTPLDDYHPWNVATYHQVGCTYSARASAVFPDAWRGPAVTWACSEWDTDKPPPNPQQELVSSSHYRFIDDDSQFWLNALEGAG